MNISVRTINTNNYNAKNKQQNNNKPSNQVSFKGVTEGAIPEYWNVCQGNTYARQIYRYHAPKGATPNYPGAYPNAYTKIYRADPFEIIPEEAYRTHDFTVRDDLRLSQIQNDYQRGPMNFSQNAANEKLFLEAKRNEAIKNAEEHLYRIDEYGKRIEYANHLRADNVKGSLIQERNNHRSGLAYQRGQVDVLQDHLENAQERYNLLRQMDDLANEKAGIQKDYQYQVERKAHIHSYIEHVPSRIEEKLGWGRYHKERLYRDLQESDQRVNDAVKKGVSGDDYKALLEKEMKAKLDAREHCVSERNRYAKRIRELRAEVAREKALLPEIEANIKSLEVQLYFIGQKMDKVMGEISKLYKAKYPMWL